MNTYTDHDGHSYTMNQTRSRLSQDLYADLVAAIHIGRALQAKCERLEEQVASWTTAFSWLQHERDWLVAENARLRAELDRLELVS